MGSLGCFGWWQADMDQTTRFALSFGAGATALVIPFTVIALGRSYASAAVIPVLLVCMAMQAVSFHNFVGVVIEKPRKAAFDLGLLPLEAEVTRTTRLADQAQAALDQFPALVQPACKCPLTKEANLASWERTRAPMAQTQAATKADRQTAVTALAEARSAYQPMVPELALWIIGGLLDISIAAAIWALETTSRKLRKEHEAKVEAKAKAEARRDEQRKIKAREERAAKRKIREKAKAKAVKARPSAPFVPRLVAANDH
jgi:hypothetical protein